MSQTWQVSHPLLSLEAEGESCLQWLELEWCGQNKRKERLGGKITLIGSFSSKGQWKQQS